MNDYPQAECDSLAKSVMPQSILEQLKSKQLRAQNELDKTNQAIAALEGNPQVADVFEKVMKALRM